MSINSTIISALTPYAPTAFHHYTGTATTYITFFTYHQGANLNADNEEISTRYSVQIDIFGKGNLETLAKNVKNALSTYGFRRVSEVEMYETSSRTYRKMLSFLVVFDAEQ